jgi:hypothetical protein
MPQLAVYTRLQLHDSSELSDAALASLVGHPWDQLPAVSL